MDTTVCVMLSTYNGEKYIEEQIKSILNQKDVAVDLYIRDDGSRDRTKEIISRYESNDNVFITYGNNMGVGNSFMHILYSCGEYSYYAFADQDDIWLEKKLRSALGRLEAHKDEPYLYTSNQYVADQFGEKTALRYKEYPPYDLQNMIVLNRLAGCTMVFNHRLKEILTDKKVRPEEDFLRMRIHDTWVGLVANCVGNIIYDHGSYILYRQHGNNVEGAKEKNALDHLKAYIGALYKKTHLQVQRQTAKQLKDSLAEYRLNPGAEDILNQFYGLYTFRGRILFCFNHKLIKEISGSSKLIRLKVLINGW